MICFAFMMILLGGAPDAGTRHVPVAPQGEIQSAACSD
jgi:hypothetical protein